MIGSFKCLVQVKEGCVDWFVLPSGFFPLCDHRYELNDGIYCGSIRRKAIHVTRLGDDVNYSGDDHSFEYLRQGW